MVDKVGSNFQVPDFDIAYSYDEKTLPEYDNYKFSLTEPDYLPVRLEQNIEEKSFLGEVFSKIWNLPNTAVGILWGIAGLPFGAKMRFGNNAIQFEKHPFMNDYSGITLGNVIAYGSKTNEREIGDHERQHTYQGEILGPAYLPAHIFEGTKALILDGDWHGESNRLESGPMNPDVAVPFESEDE